MKRCWEETHRLGAALVASPYSRRDELAAGLRELDKYFELCSSPEEEAMHSLLDGLIAVQEVGASYPRNSDDDV